MARAFAHSYVVCRSIAPRSFLAAVHPGRGRPWVELLCLSFATLSSTGLSERGADPLFARVLVMLEELAGPAYLAMLVSRLEGLTTLRRPD